MITLTLALVLMAFVLTVVAGAMTDGPVRVLAAAVLLLCFVLLMVKV